MSDDESQEQTIAEDLVVTKYKMGGDIANRVLKMVVDAAMAGVSVVALCEKGDEMIMEETGKIFKKEKEMKKGIAFPTCISVNNCVCHYSPLKSDPDYILKEEDLVKVDLGVHVDGFIANVAHSFIIGVDKVCSFSEHEQLMNCESTVMSPEFIFDSTSNTQVTEAWNKIAQSFNCTPIEGMLSHQLKQHVIDGEKTIIQNPTDQQKFVVVVSAFPGEYVAQFKFTVLLMPNGPMRITSGTFENELYKSELDVKDPDLKVSPVKKPHLKLIFIFSSFAIRQTQN
ncbi:proliferation-associated protein 2G4a [Rhincodon typus]|uniref:proliferation-associated protein 2G4a n=1 Tax=Rhincodon typus TaxID=259920 RepID=UPI00202FDFF2|nr:proliferation-associated protein 2G4a [Rhincodon typus]